MIYDHIRITGGRCLSLFLTAVLHWLVSSLSVDLLSRPQGCHIDVISVSLMCFLSFHVVCFSKLSCTLLFSLLM